MKTPAERPANPSLCVWKCQCGFTAKSNSAPIAHAKGGSVSLHSWAVKVRRIA